MATREKDCLMFTGAKSGEIVVGINPLNYGTRIKLLEDQEITDKANKLKGKFIIENAGFGKYKKAFGHFLNHATNAEEFFQIGNRDFETMTYPISTDNLRLASLEKDFHLAEEEFESETLYEGGVTQVYVNIYERNPTVRRKCIEANGYHCTVCQFNFESFYGSLGKGYIHVHHLKPLAEIRGTYLVDPVKDLIPICPNCHAMLHRRKNELSVEGLKTLVRERQIRN